MYQGVIKEWREMKWKLVVVTLVGLLKLNAFAFPCNGVMAPYSKISAADRTQLSSTPSEDILQDSVFGQINSSSKYYIREALYSDLPQVANLMTLSFSPESNDPIRKLFESCRLQTTFPRSGDRNVFLVAYTSRGSTENDDSNREESIIGFCKIDGRDETQMFRTLIQSFPQFSLSIPRGPYATDLAVHPDFRRRGVGSAIMCAAEFRAKNWGAETLFLGVESNNESALKMYISMGYEIFLEGLVEGAECVHLLRRRLR
jgi:ribosomal protein S18 acetylase RimI-like enzyme